MMKENKLTQIPVRAWDVLTGDSPPINLEARFQNGDAYFFAYAYLDYCHFNQGGVIELHFTSRILRLEGRDLSGLYAALAKHAVGVVQQSEASDQRAEHDALIDKIEVTDAES